MLLPKRVKYRRQHRGRMRGEAHKGNFVAYGDFGLQAQEASWITSRQIEALEQCISEYRGKTTKIIGGSRAEVCG